MDEFEKLKRRQQLKTGRKQGQQARNSAKRKPKKTDFQKDAETVSKFAKAKQKARTETAKDKVNPMKGQRHFMDTSKYRQKANVKKMYETGVDQTTGRKLTTPSSSDLMQRFENVPGALKQVKEDFFKPTKRDFTKFLKGGGISQRGLGKAFMKGGKVK